jgi:hypothetical protein
MATTTGRTRTLTYQQFSRANSQPIDVDKEEDKWPDERCRRNNLTRPMV